MEFEAWLVISGAVMVASIVLDWPRALAGLALGAISRYLPYATIIIPIGIILIAAAGEFIYPIIGRTAEPSLASFVLGLFSVAGTASGLYITVRNLKDRL